MIDPLEAMPNQEVDPQQLWDELTAAGITVPGVGTPDGSKALVHTYKDGFPEPLPLEAEPIVLAHVPIPPPMKYLKNITVVHKARTTTGTATEFFRVTLQEMTGYDVNMRLIATDAVNFAVKKLVLDITVKRGMGAPSQVGQNTIQVNHSEAGSAGWTGGIIFDGNDLVIMVTGATGRTIDWGMLGSVNRFVPAGED